ncbi:hypothetical protein [Pseudoalteromonas sp. SG44-17]|uniref:hypothetical protein n=1 Tax=Pseudoalteromonas sp. SG44-17 TaxID=2760963 RepID=UPI0015FFF5C9|nr:hypothetical protein [Pseudoalteromonas sp. SG44-17]MBB1411765.1 hypothetical protein [Pseudoalteromonas sp. SG44-17]
MMTTNMNQLKFATTKAKDGLFDEAIEILLFTYQSGISSDADILKILPYYQKAGRYNELEKLCQEQFIPQLEQLNHSTFSHKCEEIQKSFLSLKLYKLYAKLALCAERENQTMDEKRFISFSQQYYRVYEELLEQGTKVEELKEFKSIAKRYGKNSNMWPEFLQKKFSKYIK